MKYTEAEIKERLEEVMNETLRSDNQDGGQKITSIDLKNMKVTFELDIVIFEEDDYVGFQGY